ncbi:MAG: hypothetical protein ACMUJM_01940 [bacterium]
MKKVKVCLLISFMLFIGIALLYSPIAEAQNWAALPPYNTLWPLWSPALSPIDDSTGLPTPIVSSLEPDIVLPVMPGLTWDPSIPYPWMLYNSPLGMVYFDPLLGINAWPAPSLLNDKGKALPLTLPNDFANLPLTDPVWLASNLLYANLYFLIDTYFPIWPPSSAPTVPLLSSFLTPADILGPTVAVPSLLTPLLSPTGVLIPAPPAPTVQIPTLPIPTVPVVTAPVPIIPPPIAPVPTIPVATAPAPTVSIPAIPAPPVPIVTAPVPTIPIPTAPVPAIPVATLVAPTIPIVTAPAPTIPVPTIPIPTLPVPTIPVPTVPVPTIPVPTVPVTATVLGFFL